MSLCSCVCVANGADCSVVRGVSQAIYNMVGTMMTDSNADDTPEKRTREIFEKMDENSDGVLSKDEFVKGCMSDQFLYQMLTADTSMGE